MSIFCSKSTYRGIVVSCSQVVRTALGVEILTAVTEWVSVGGYIYIVEICSHKLAGGTVGDESISSRRQRHKQTI